MNPDTGRQQRVEVGSDEEMDWLTAAEYRREKKEVKKKVDKALDTLGNAATRTLQSEAGQRVVTQARDRATAVGRGVARAGSASKRLAGGTVGRAVATIGGAGVAAAVLTAGAAGFTVGYFLNKWIERNRDQATPEAIGAKRTLLIIQQRREWEKNNGRAMTQNERATFNRNAGL